MRAVLRALYDETTAQQAAETIRSAERLQALRRDVESRVLVEGKLGRVPVGDYGDNLLLALLSLRVKFSQDEGFQKLETNIAMRQTRDGRGFGQP
jgi:hypothetical protein